MRVFGVAGWSGSGKTLLMTRLIPALAERGLAVSTLKHTHHDLDLDRPDSDSDRHRRAGAAEVLVAAPHRWALLREHRAAPEPALGALLARFAPVDLVLVEGFRHAALPKLEVWRRSDGEPALAPGDAQVQAVVGDRPDGAAHLPVFDPAAVDAIAAFVIDRAAPPPPHDPREP